VSECFRCAAYERTRGPRIKREISLTHSGEAADARWRRYLAAFHDMHVRAGRFAALMALVQEADEAARREELLDGYDPVPGLVARGVAADPEEEDEDA
jgi:hypothetical protein